MEVSVGTTPAEGSKPIQRALKRLLDVVVSAVGMVVLLPVFLLLILAVKLTSRGPAFYRWEVIGKGCRPFRSYKFRTMVANADQIKRELMTHNEMMGPVFKMREDPRITQIGRFLRKYSLDELPQVWSVFKGDMSLVGPRPCLQSELPHFSEWHRQKFAVTPGITCLWQISGRNEIKDFDMWVKMDLEYIEHWSFWLDLKILVKTIPAVLSGRGAS